MSHDYTIDDLAADLRDIDTDPPRDLLGQIDAEPMTGRQRPLWELHGKDQSEPQATDATDERIRRQYDPKATPPLFGADA